MAASHRKFEFLLSDKYHDTEPGSLPAGALWQGFKDHTTAHGISHWNNARGCLKKVYWLFFSLCSLAAMCYYGYGIVVKFMEFPVTVTVSVDHQAELTFPAITFCNSNPVRASAIKDDPYLSSLLGIETSSNGSGNGTGNVTLDYGSGGVNPLSGIGTEAGGRSTQSGVHMGNGSTTTELNGIPTGGGTFSPPGRRRRKRQDNSGSQQRTNEKGRAMKGNFALSLQFQQYIAELTVEEKSSKGHSVEEFLLQCHYGGYECNSSDFHTLYNTKYGNCFTFNSGWTSAEALEVSRTPGPEYGLEVVFNLDQNEYIGHFTEVAGVRMVVHHQDSMPFPEDEGVTVHPGALTFVGLRKETISREPAPFGNCTEIDGDESVYSNVYEEIYPVSYTTKACLKTCIQMHTIDSCKCADSKYPVYGEAFNYQRVPICDLTNDTDSGCVEGVLELYKHGQLDCDCPTACSESLFTTQISSGLWPANQHRGNLFTDLAQTGDKARLVIESGTYLENFAKVIVYYEEFNLEAITEIPSYPPSQFVSDIGGILGLFIGFSLLTIMEFVELVLDLMVLCWYKTFKKVPNATAPSTSDPSADGGDDGKGVRGAWSPPPGYNTVTRTSDKTSTAIHRLK